MDWRSGRVLPELQLLLLTSARGEFETRETGKVAIRNHAVVVVFPGVWHRYRPDRSYGWTERWISLNCWAAKQAIDAGIIRPGCPVFESNNMQEAVELFDAMAHHAQARPNGQHATISQAATKLMQLATDSDDFPFPRQTSTGGGNGEAKWDPIVEEAREIIWNHENLRNVCVSEVAKYLPVTRRTLDRRFASTLGQSVLEEINTCRLWRAKRLLEQTDLLVKTVAYLSGFPNRERMRLLFLSQAGMTPSEYRHRMARTVTMNAQS